MSNKIRPAVTTAVAATIVGAVGGGVFWTATGQNLHVYMRFVGVLVLVALVAVGIWAYQRFFKPQAPAVEEAPDGR